MEWNSSRKKLPDDGIKVLVVINDSFFLAVFSRDNGGFKLHDGSFLWIEHEAVLWTVLLKPAP